MKRIILLLLLLLNINILQAINIETNIDKEKTNLKELRIGDRIYLNIKITHSAQDSVSLDRSYLEDNQKDSDFSIISMQKEVYQDNEANVSQYNFQSTFFDTGEQTIPSLKFKVIQKNDTTTVFSDSIAVQINSVIAEDSTGQNIRDIAQPVAISLTAWDIIFPLIILVAIVIIILLLVKRRSVKSIIPTKKEKIKPAHVIALKKLDKLAISNLLEEGKIKQFYVSLSWICREYLENRYQIPVLESTTSEIRKLTKKSGVEFYTKFVSFLRECDKVKYARYHRNIDESRQMLEELKDLIYKTRKQPLNNQNEDNIS